MRNKGFTLMELLVVVALIMILSAIGVGSFISSAAKSLDTQRKNDLNQLAKAAESFNSDVGRYPISTATGGFTCYKVDNLAVPPTKGDMSCISSKLSFTNDTKVTNYITWPTDPDLNQKYYYKSDGSTFSLYTTIQNDQDKDLFKDVDGNIITYDVTDSVDCGVLECNYKISETGKER